VSGDDGDSKALFAASGPLALKVAEGASEKTQVVLEEYTFTHAADLPSDLGAALKSLFADDPIWKEVASRLVILSNGMMSFFAQNACEVAQHVRISDETGTAEGGALFNQENVPSETLFYGVVHFFPGRGPTFRHKTAKQALEAFRGDDDQAKPGVRDGSAFQFGGDASTGLGYCTVRLAEPCAASSAAAS
jgi:CRISPR-associated protein Cmr4